MAGAKGGALKGHSARLRAAGARRSSPRRRPCRPRARTRGDESSAMFAFCSTTSTLSPSSAFSSVTIRKSSCVTVGASPSEGSSSISSRGRETSARASASICCSPPLSVPACWFFAPLQPGEVAEHARRLRLERPPLAADVRAHAQVVPDRELGEEPAALGHVRHAEPRDRLGRASRSSARRTRRRRTCAPRPRSRAASSSCPRRSRRAARRPRPRRPSARRRAARGSARSAPRRSRAQAAASAVPR